MNIKNAYNSWAAQYDTNQNKTRDLEAKILRNTLSLLNFEQCLEIGCGTGKNTEWLLTKAKQLTAVDFSEGMLRIAKEKIKSPNVFFSQADISHDWSFATQKYNLIVFSLVLEHIEKLEPIFAKTAQALQSNGYVYVAELHPFKQYAGSKARFDTENGQQIVDCFTHHLSDFINAAKAHKLELIKFEEGFDADDRSTVPRIVCLLFRKVF